jgi:hypothetical protein
MSAHAIGARRAEAGAIDSRSATLQLTAEAIALRAAIPVLLRLWPLDRVLRTLVVEGTRWPSTAELLSEVERVSDLLTRRLPLTRSACLQRSLMRYGLLRRHGLEPRFLIGVRAAGGSDGFEAHAWLTLDGAPIMERKRVDCRTTFEWPPDLACSVDSARGSC